MNQDHLKLDNQLCFRFYTIARLITHIYQPYLNKYGLTYIQYIVLLVLWEEDNVPIGTIVKRVGLNTNTLTPLLKRMEEAGWLSRKKSPTDERSRIISLTKQGQELQHKLADLPQTIQNSFTEQDRLSQEDYLNTCLQLDKIIRLLSTSKE